MNQFPYTKNPKTTKEAQQNINFWWYEGMEFPEGTLKPHWDTYIREMKRAAAKDMKNVLTKENL